jgi:SpoVK/Ycf46/Vps4 family AAA+-type ATPase
VGEGEKLVKAVFSLARRLSPCVVFLDEIDALFGARMSARESGSAFAHRGVITEFMQEMDGLKSSKDDNVIVIGATNRPFDLDDAVLRRLPRRLLVDLPGEKERQGNYDRTTILLFLNSHGIFRNTQNLASRREHSR